VSFVFDLCFFFFCFVSLSLERFGRSRAAPKQNHPAGSLSLSLGLRAPRLSLLLTISLSSKTHNQQKNLSPQTQKKLLAVSILGFVASSATTGEGPYACFTKHINDPFGYNLLTVLRAGEDRVPSL
jgi:hypothetical protein